MFMYITTFGRSLDVLGTLLNNLAKSSTDAALEAMHTRMYALLRWRTYIVPLSEFLEHLASDNGADMHKHNTLYTHRLNRHVLTPESSKIIYEEGSLRYDRSRDENI